MADPKGTPVLEVRGLNVFYGASHALQGVDLTLQSGTLSVVGRNGMGKTTLCKTIVGLKKAASGSIRFLGQEISGLDAAGVARQGIAYVPQGRRLWPSLTVDEHLRLTMSAKRSAWTPERVYDTFPRLAERKQNRGNQLSGGEQQMLAISRALLLDPKLLVMDEPTEGLAPVIVAHVEDLLIRLAGEGSLSVLIIEQNIGVATSVSDTVAIMVNGRVNRTMRSAELAADRDLQQRLLGVGRPGEGDAPTAAPAPTDALPVATVPKGPLRIYNSNPVLPTRWSQPIPLARLEAAARTVTPVSRSTGPALVAPSAEREPVVLIAGTFDTKSEDLQFLAGILRASGQRVRLVDLSTSGRPSAIEIPPHQIAAFHRRGAAGVFTGNRETAIPAMAEAFAAWLQRQTGIAGMLAAGGAAGTAAVLPAMRALPVGVPKLLVSTVPAPEVAGMIGGADILVLPSITDMGGLNAVSRRVLTNAGQAMAGMVAAQVGAAAAQRGRAGDLPAIGLAFCQLTEGPAMALAAALKPEAEVIRFKGAAGATAMERMAEAGQLTGLINLSATDLAAHVITGSPGGATRFQGLTRARLPALIVPGGADGLYFPDTSAIPPALLGRARVNHGTDGQRVAILPAEAAQLGDAIARRLNRADAGIRVILPEGGLSDPSLLHDPAMVAALAEAIERGLTQTASRRLIRSPLHIGSPDFTATLVAAWHSLAGRPRRRVMP